MASELNNDLVITVEYRIKGDSKFIKVLGAWLDETKKLAPNDEISIWDFDPEDTVVSVAY